MTVFDWMLVFSLAILISVVILVLCNQWLGKWACDKMGWHLAPAVIHCDEVNMSGKCPRCGKNVLLDGQGNWFACSNQEG